MIIFTNLSQATPFLTFKKKYDEAISAKQKNIEAIAISSFNKITNEVESRYVNLKFINEDKFIFFSNYNSPKSLAFKTHNQISATFYWPSTNTQIRMKAKINKTSTSFNDQYFKNRSDDKNALAISSDQSQKTKSYSDIIKKYEEVKNNYLLSECPDYWGGYSFIPYYFEFWEGHKSRLNKRDIYEEDCKNWNHYILQP
jgi:pyridoxamine 5'-phosphate oxidase